MKALRLFGGFESLVRGCGLICLALLLYVLSDPRAVRTRVVRWLAEMSQARWNSEIHSGDQCNA
jgi:hypothetical protein